MKLEILFGSRFAEIVNPSWKMSILMELTKFFYEFLLIKYLTEMLKMVQPTSFMIIVY